MSLIIEAKGRVTSFPTEPLSSSIELIGKIVSKVGERTSTLKEIAVSTGIGEGTLPLPISTACQYGVLENIHGSGYKPTTLYHRINTPTFEHDKELAKFEALSNPSLYKQILNVFNGKILPDEKGFSNYLKTTFKFKDYAIPKIVKAFFQNFASSIDANNKLRFIAPIKKNDMESNIIDIESEEVKSKQLPQAVIKNRSAGNFLQTIPLPDEKMIFLEYPKGSMTVEDFQALKAFINFLELSEGIANKKPSINEGS